MKKIKFYPELADLIILGEKTSTWRVDDDKDLQIGDEVIFIKSFNLKEFAKAKLIDVIEKKFCGLSDEDFDGHEKFSTDEEMYEAYSKYYGKKIDQNNLVKIIKFEILKFL